MRAVSQRTYSSIFIAIVVLAAGIRIYGLNWGLPEVYEEATPLRKAWAMWGWGPLKEFDLNPHFFKYPSLTIYLQFIAQAFLFLFMKVSGAVQTTMDFRLVYLLETTPFFIVGRSITMLLGTAAVAATFRLADRIGGLTAAITAALLLAVHTFHVSKSQVIEVDVPLTLLVVLALIFATRIIEWPTRKQYVLAGLAIGLATSTKYTAAFLLIPFVVAHFLSLQRLRQTKKKNVEPARLWRQMGFGCVIAVVAFLVTSPFVVLDPQAFWTDLSAERQHMSVGHFGTDTASTWGYYFGALTERLLGWPLFILSTVGLIFLAIVRRRPWAIVLATFAVVYWLAVSSWAMKADRYLLPVLPVMLIFGGAMLAKILRHDRTNRLPAAGRVLVTTVMIAILATPLLAAYPDHFARLKPDPRTEARVWVENNVAKGSLIALEFQGPEFFDPFDIWTEDLEMRNRLLSEASNIPLYAIQRIPMFQVQPERSEIFYDLRLFETADFVIISSAVKSRYTKDPKRFARQIAFYDSLHASFEQVAEFVPRGGKRSIITIYKNPRQTKAFVNRSSIQIMPELPLWGESGTGSEAYFYFAYGLNCETFRFFEPALLAYRAALPYKYIPPRTYLDVSFGISRCLVAMGDQQAAGTFLERAALAAPDPGVRRQLEQTRRQLLAGKLKYVQ